MHLDIATVLPIDRRACHVAGLNLNIRIVSFIFYQLLPANSSARNWKKICFTPAYMSYYRQNRLADRETYIRCTKYKHFMFILYIQTLRFYLLLFYGFTWIMSFHYIMYSYKPRVDRWNSWLGPECPPSGQTSSNVVKGVTIWITQCHFNSLQEIWYEYVNSKISMRSRLSLLWAWCYFSILLHCFFFGGF